MSARVARGRFWTTALLVFLPLLAFMLVRLVPALDVLIEARLFHFYIVSYTSFVGLVAAIFVSSAVPRSGEARTLFFTLAFGAIGAIFMHHGLATPGVLIPGFNPMVVWAAPFSLTAGAFMFVLSTITWGPEAERWILQNRRGLWLLAGTLYLIFVAVGYSFPPSLDFFSQLGDGFEYALAGLTIAAFLWAAAKSLDLRGSGRNAFDTRMGIALILMAEAQIAMTFGPVYQISWWIYHVIMLAGFALAMWAIAQEFEALQSFRPASYFAALGSISAVGLALLSGEVAGRLFEMPDLRLGIMIIVLAVATTLFLILNAIVLRADRVIVERTANLHREQNMRRELTHLIVHDLKNPLSAVIGSLSAVVEGTGGALTDVQQRFVDHSMRGAQDTLRLIDDLLDLERLEEGALKLEVSRFDVQDLLRERVDTVQGLATQREQQILLSVDGGPRQLEADRQLIARVVDNLLSNAIKYASLRGTIEVRLSADDGSLRVSVADDGPGVPAEARARIFKKFGQVPGTERRGAGLGLAFSKMAVEAHAGSIWVDGNQGGGAVFTFSLPVESAPPNA